jgi:endonuclease YncB( thermonuclease family)
MSQGCQSSVGDVNVSSDSSLYSATVSRAIDGDTIELENGEVVRYLGIDTPETVHPDEPVECFGPEASERNKQLVEGKAVELQSDGPNTDSYGRLLRQLRTASSSSPISPTPGPPDPG